MTRKRRATNPYPFELRSFDDPAVYPEGRTVSRHVTREAADERLRYTLSVVRKRYGASAFLDYRVVEVAPRTEPEYVDVARNAQRIGYGWGFTADVVDEPQVVGRLRTVLEERAHAVRVAARAGLPLAEALFVAGRRVLEREPELVLTDLVTKGAVTVRCEVRS